MESEERGQPKHLDEGKPSAGEGAQDRREMPPPMASRAQGGWLFWLVLIGTIAAVVLWSYADGRREIPSWADFQRIVEEDGVAEESIVVRNDRIDATLKPDFEYGEIKEETDRELPVYLPIDGENRSFYLERLDQLGIAWRADTSRFHWGTLLLIWSPLLILLVLLAWGLTRARQAAASGPAGMLGDFARSRHRVASKESVQVTLDDVAGIDEAKAEVDELIQFLKRPRRFQVLGARVPRGVLIEGPPGCGKTLLARAIAGEADVPFFSISGSDFMEMFVGVGASRVRDLFAKAKRNAPCIIFLDEIDAIGRKRTGEVNVGGGHGEREQTLNAILSEMDGFEPSDRVIVIAATNRPDVLDPALTRRGRFDRQVTVPLPDRGGRKAILQIHAEKMRLGDDIDLDELARMTPMFSGADLAALVNEAGIIGGIKGHDRVRMEDVREARDKVRFGRPRESLNIEDEQRVKSAYHEAGHALLQAMLENADPIEKVSIIPRGQALGATFALPEKDRYSLGRKYLEATMRVACGGRIAEAKKSGDLSSGAADDIKRVTAIARKMVFEWGMSERLGFIKYADEEAQARLPLREQSERTAAQADEEVRRLVGAAYSDAEQLIEQRWDAVDAIAQSLLDRETLTADDIHNLVQATAADASKQPAEE